MHFPIVFHWKTSIGCQDILVTWLSPSSQWARWPQCTWLDLSFKIKTGFVWNLFLLQWVSLSVVANHWWSIFTRNRSFFFVENWQKLSEHTQSTESAIKSKAVTCSDSEDTWHNYTKMVELFAQLSLRLGHRVEKFAIISTMSQSANCLRFKHVNIFRHISSLASYASTNIFHSQSRSWHLPKGKTSFPVCFLGPETNSAQWTFGQWEARTLERWRVMFVTWRMIGAFAMTQHC